MRRLTLSLTFVVCTYASVGLCDESTNSEDMQLQRYHDLTLVLRCPKCQNQNIAESTSPIAEDIRFEINRMIESGKSNDQIIDFMVGRYGEFVLYDPKLSSKTVPLYVGPVAMLLTGLLAVAAIFLTRRREQIKPDTQLSEDEQERLVNLLHEAGQSSERNS
ncbi:MAG: cytochrome c-type biogenesis protein CcmH [Nevskiaceae bacterium]|nr:MAG: cytochrome c-type biogenesis protein CcmH [Nevskiaceae bacterium]